MTERTLNFRATIGQGENIYLGGRILPATGRDITLSAIDKDIKHLVTQIAAGNIVSVDVAASVFADENSWKAFNENMQEELNEIGQTVEPDEVIVDWTWTDGAAAFNIVAGVDLGDRGFDTLSIEYRFLQDTTAGNAWTGTIQPRLPGNAVPVSTVANTATLIQSAGTAIAAATGATVGAPIPLLSPLMATIDFTASRGRIDIDAGMIGANHMVALTLHMDAINSTTAGGSLQSATFLATQISAAAAEMTELWVDISALNGMEYRLLRK